MSTDLAVKILAAIEEVERIARAATVSPWQEGCERRLSVHIALHDPERELRRCAADRKIVGLYVSARDCDVPTDRAERLVVLAERSALLEAVRALAEGYGIEEGE